MPKKILPKGLVRGARRSGIELIADILEEARQGMTKTRLVYRTNLNFVVMRKHLDFLLDKGLLERVEEPAQLYRTSPKGVEFLKEFRRMKEILGVPESYESEMHSYL